MFETISTPLSLALVVLVIVIVGSIGFLTFQTVKNSIEMKEVCEKHNLTGMQNISIYGDYELYNLINCAEFR